MSMYALLTQRAARMAEYWLIFLHFYEVRRSLGP